jgi:hypothetical protein
LIERSGFPNTEDFLGVRELSLVLFRMKTVVVILLVALYALSPIGNSGNAYPIGSIGANRRSYMANYYCKWCGHRYPDARTLLINHCKQNPEAQTHALYEGTEKKEYVCKYCGWKYRDMRTMCINTCKASPSKTHSPAL